MTTGVVRRRRALRAAQNSTGDPVLNADGTPKQLFDFDLRVQGVEGQTRMLTVFMSNEIACECAFIKPGDRVSVEGAGAKTAPAPEDDGIDAHITMNRPCTVKVFVSLPRARGDASTQLAHSEVARVCEFSKVAVPVRQPKRSVPGSAGAPAGPGPSQTTKRRRRESSASKYMYTALGDLKSGVANFFGVVVGGTFPKKTSNDHLATYQLVDESTWHADQRDPRIFTVSVFCPAYKDAPVVHKVGDVLRCHRLKISKFKGSACASGNTRKRCGFVTFGFPDPLETSSAGSRPDVAVVASSSVDSEAGDVRKHMRVSSTSTSATITDSDYRRVNELQDWFRLQLKNHPLPRSGNFSVLAVHPALQPSNTAPRAHSSYHDLLVRVDAPPRTGLLKGFTQPVTYVLISDPSIWHTTSKSAILLVWAHVDSIRSQLLAWSKNNTPGTFLRLRNVSPCLAGSHTGQDILTQNSFCADFSLHENASALVVPPESCTVQYLISQLPTSPDSSSSTSSSGLPQTSSLQHSNKNSASSGSTAEPVGNDAGMTLVGTKSAPANPGTTDNCSGSGPVSAVNGSTFVAALPTAVVGAGRNQRLSTLADIWAWASHVSKVKRPAGVEALVPNSVVDQPGIEHAKLFRGLFMAQVQEPPNEAFDTQASQSEFVVALFRLDDLSFGPPITVEVTITDLKELLGGETGVRRAKQDRRFVLRRLRESTAPGTWFHCCVSARVAANGTEVAYRLVNTSLCNDSVEDPLLTAP
eukprot:INCI8236.2.p1 GENE.INCI8236.2~~INCI8236.2.p1  ORF type:complete len:754 (+),score=77.00 INCI8236.2:156-2417(+)